MTDAAHLLAPGGPLVPRGHPGRAARHRRRPRRLRHPALQPGAGGCHLLRLSTVHAAPGFPHPGRRRVLSLRYLSAGARHAPRAWRTSPPFDGLADQLAAGPRWTTRCSRSSGQPDLTPGTGWAPPHAGARHARPAPAIGSPTTMTPTRPRPAWAAEPGCDKAPPGASSSWRVHRHAAMDNVLCPAVSARVFVGCLRGGCRDGYLGDWESGGRGGAGWAWTSGRKP